MGNARPAMICSIAVVEPYTADAVANMNGGGDPARIRNRGFTVAMTASLLPSAEATASPTR